MSDTDSDLARLNPEENDALLSRLNLIDAQPLDARAAAFTQLHDELQAALEGSDAGRHHA
jgi:hypothetical protein